MVDRRKRRHARAASPRRPATELAPEAFAASGGCQGARTAVARLAGIRGREKISEIAPLCHLFAQSRSRSRSNVTRRREAVVTATARITGKTGVEMEALTAVAASCLALYDMIKAIDRSAAIREIVLLEKSGGRSGVYRRK
jgi:cyclic pyranopterin phosphate synthase